uniref:Serpin domain-containing protein n=1 Tax=Timema genevievae TaxID=629358 RepID=A0A7R9JTH0_TIMGE|nr:unnamed protein product [Timema genevievae]
MLPDDIILLSSGRSQNRPTAERRIIKIMLLSSSLPSGMENILKQRFTKLRVLGEILDCVFLSRIMLSDKTTMPAYLGLVQGLFSLWALILCYGVTLAAFDNKRLADSANKFSVELLKVVCSLNGDGNVIISPVSVSTLLALLNQGSHDTTRQQLESVLNLSTEESRQGYGGLVHMLEVANHLFVARGWSVRPEFRQTASRDFLSGVEEVTFGNGLGAVAINSWATAATHGRIGAIVPPEGLPHDTVMVLANAIFFKGLWLKPFKRAFTTEHIFSPQPGATISVPFMEQEGDFVFGDDPNLGAKWIELPFNIVDECSGTNESRIVNGHQLDSCQPHGVVVSAPGYEVPGSIPGWCLGYFSRKGNYPN